MCLVLWDGIYGIDPVEFNWHEEMPTFVKPIARPINPKLFENAKVEFDRLCKYFYKESDSPVASCLVIAPKATKPFIRFCGDYSTMMNKYFITGRRPKLALHQLRKEMRK